MMERDYEGLFILEPTLSEEAVEKESKDITLLFPEGAADCRNLGLKKFTYQIKHQTQGYYLSVNFKADAGKRTEFEQRVRSNPAVLRYLIILAPRIKRKEKNGG